MKRAPWTILGILFFMGATAYADPRDRAVVLSLMLGTWCWCRAVLDRVRPEQQEDPS